MRVLVLSVQETIFWLYCSCSKKFVSVMVPHICVCHAAALESAQEARLALRVLPSQDFSPALLHGDFVSTSCVHGYWPQMCTADPWCPDGVAWLKTRLSGCDKQAHLHLFFIPESGRVIKVSSHCDEEHAVPRCEELFGLFDIQVFYVCTIVQQSRV